MLRRGPGGRLAGGGVGLSTPSGGTAVVIGTYAGRATLVSTRTGKVTARITVGLYPVAVAIAG